MTTLLIVAILSAAAVVSLHMVLTWRSGGFTEAPALWQICGCGHPAAFHKDGGGCRRTHSGSTDCYGYCTCPRAFADVPEAYSEPSGPRHGKVTRA